MMNLGSLTPKLVRISFFRNLGPASLVAKANVVVTASLFTAPPCCSRRPVFEGPTPPKKPLNAYSLFVVDNLDTFPRVEKNCPDLRRIGSYWRAKTQDEQQVYKTKSALLKVEHEQNFKEFLEREVGDEEKQKSYLQSLKDYASAKRKYLKEYRLKKQGLIEPRKKSGHNVYMAEALKDVVMSNLAEDTVPALKKANEGWNALSEKTKQKYVDQAEMEHRRNMAAYELRRINAIASGILKEPKIVQSTKKKTASEKKKTASKKQTKNVKKETSEDEGLEQEKDKGGKENVEDGLFSDSDEDSYSDSIQLGNPHSSS